MYRHGAYAITSMTPVEKQRGKRYSQSWTAVGNEGSYGVLTKLGSSRSTLGEAVPRRREVDQTPSLADSGAIRLTSTKVPQMNWCRTAFKPSAV